MDADSGSNLCLLLIGHVIISRRRRLGRKALNSVIPTLYSILYKNFPCGFRRGDIPRLLRANPSTCVSDRAQHERMGLSLSI